MIFPRSTSFFCLLLEMVFKLVAVAILDTQNGYFEFSWVSLTYIGYMLCSVTQSCPALCNAVDCSPPVSSVPGIFQVRILKWVAISSPGDLLDPRIKPVSLASSELEGKFLPLCHMGSLCRMCTYY